MSDRVYGYDLRYRYKVLDMRDQDSEHFLNSNNPDALVLAILCDPKNLEPNALVAHIIKELRRLHGDKLDNLRDSLKMLDVLSGNRGLQDIVEETINMYIDEEKLGIYQAVKKRSEARGLERGRQEIILKLLAKFSPEQVADISGFSLDKVKTIATASKS